VREGRGKQDSGRGHVTSGIWEGGRGAGGRAGDWKGRGKKGNIMLAIVGKRIVGQKLNKWKRGKDGSPKGGGGRRKRVKEKLGT